MFIGLLQATLPCQLVREVLPEQRLLGHPPSPRPTATATNTWESLSGLGPWPSPSADAVYGSGSGGGGGGDVATWLAGDVADSAAPLVLLGWTLRRREFFQGVTKVVTFQVWDG